MKCHWCQDGSLLEHYHDTEWGLPCHSDKLLFEYLMLECMSSGLSRKLMLQKREIFKACFADFDYKAVAAFTEEDVNRAVDYPGMIKSRRKIEAVVSNARNFIKLQQEFGSFDQYLWAFTGGKTIIYQRHLDGEWLTKNDLSDRVAGDLKKRGFKFLGSTLIYSYLQSVGIINDHMPECGMFEKIGGVIV
ncbi:MAG: DNA-3-methyladenine glycosylase I [Bacteroidaceae bacterium]|nr:DNA-3-methyladenine glycosylase I [Bacteroidaceae bacterium]